MSGRLNRPSAGELLEEGWLPPRAAARALGVTLLELEAMADNRVIRRRAIAPGCYLYEIRKDGRP